MIQFAAFYLFGSLFSEMAMLGLWLKTQPPTATFSQYVTTRKGDIILSAAVALIFCVSWAEGTILKWVIDKWNLDLTQTLGASILAGAVISLFAPLILKGLGKWLARMLGMTDAEAKGD